MSILSLVVAVANQVFSNKLNIFLQDAGYEVSEVLNDGNETLRKLRSNTPDVVIIDYDIAPTNGFNIAQIIDEDRICAGILLLKESELAIVQSDFNLMNFAYLTKPLNKNVLISTIELINRSAKNIKKLEKEVDSLKDKLETRKEVEKAKGILMQIHGINESDAFRRMQKQSMDTGVPIKEIAKAVIIAYKL